ncbi:5521_t:CDS:2, partial [Racocetra persica]
EPAHGSTTKSPSLVVASNNTVPKLLLVNLLPVVGYFWSKKQNSALLLSQVPNPKVFFLYQTRQSTIFKLGALIIQAAIRSLPNRPLLTHKRQKALGFKTRPACSIIRII